jgi:hypothetical protein
MGGLHREQGDLISLLTNIGGITYRHQGNLTSLIINIEGIAYRQTTGGCHKPDNKYRGDCI